MNAIMRDEKIDRIMMFKTVSLAFGGKEVDVKAFLRTLKVD